MTEAYRNLPGNATVQPTPFKVDIPQQALDELKLLLRHSKVAADTYENVQDDFKFGLTTKWIRNAKEKWENQFDWRKQEAHMNSFPQYTVDIIDDDQTKYRIHFVALYSDAPDAVPIMMLHGWPGSFLEFLPILDILRSRFTPKTLPYHVIVPSLPGYAFSSCPPVDRDFKLEDASRILNKFMIGLGFGAGYVVQGGDIGSKVARILGSEYSNCKAIHLNFCIMNKTENIDDSALTDDEKAGIDRYLEFKATGSAYGIMHATRPSTIGIVLASNPLALLAWIGEKFIAWTDETPELDTILKSIALYWFTETLPSSIYPYRQTFTASVRTHNLYRISKPLGYSLFPKEIAPLPRSWVATTGNLVFFRQHTNGGHFAALEQPESLLKDVEDFVAQVWKEVKDEKKTPEV